ncbi:MAG: TolC family protein [Candidatus Omnitrophica bacterium]|nr:TolC family protein [Candidatus Omnitrophota bacterium]
MKKILASLVTFTFIYAQLIYASEPISLTIEQALGLALRDNREILLKSQEVEKSKKKLSETISGFMPSITLGGSWSQTNELYDSSLKQTTAQGTLKQYLFRGGKAINTVSQNKAKVSVAEAVLEKTRIETVLNVQKAFYLILLAQEYASLNERIVENAKIHYQSIEIRYQKGRASSLERALMKEELENVEQVYGSSLSQVESAQTLLKNLLFIALDTEVKPQGDFSSTSDQLKWEDGYLQALKTRPEIKQYESQIKADKKGIEIAKADTRPTIYASWDYYGRSHTSGTATKNWNDYNVIGVTVSWPIFDGWTTKSKVEQAIIDLKETELSKEKVTSDIISELKNAYLDMNDAFAKIKSQEAEAAFYKEYLDEFQAKHDKGIASVLDLSDAKLAFEVSLFSQKQAVYEYLVAKARYQKAMGGRINEK